MAVLLPARPVLAFAHASGLIRPCAANTPRDTPARGCGRASLVVGQRMFSSLLSHSRRYAIRRVGRLASLVVCRRVVWFCRGGARKMRAVRPFLFWGFARPLATPAGLPSVGQPDAYGAGESRVFQRQRVSPAPPRKSARRFPTCPDKAVGAAARRFVEPRIAAFATDDRHRQK